MDRVTLVVGGMQPIKDAHVGPGQFGVDELVKATIPLTVQDHVHGGVGRKTIANLHLVLNPLIESLFIVYILISID